MAKKPKPKGSSPSSTRPSKSPDLPRFLSTRGEELLLMVKVKPGAPSSGWEGLFKERIKVRVTGPAHGGKANASLIDFLAKELGCPKKELALIRGQKSRDKTLSLTGKAKSRAIEYFREMEKGP